MKTYASLRTWLLVLGMLSALSTSALDGTLKRIVIDGSFTDWAGVPVAYSDGTETQLGADFRDIQIANDDQYLFIRFTLYKADSPFTSRNNIFIDADDTQSTGFHPLGRSDFGSELLIQSGVGYQERGGNFNEGGINGLDWAAAPTSSGVDFEVRISRAATFGSDGAPVFGTESIAILLESESTSFAAVDTAPNAGERLSYFFATAPGPFVGTRELVSFAGSAWRVNAAGQSLGTEWRETAYDDTQAGWTSGAGLFGFSPNPNLYPAPITTPLASSTSPYYLRTRFLWNNDSAGVVLVSSNLLSDGAVFYLNGVEARRVRLPQGAIAFDTSASGPPSVKGQVELVELPASSLVIGENVLAVEVHQTAGENLDLVFGTSLTAASVFPVIFFDVSQPGDRSVVAGQATTFSAELLGSEPRTYQWYKNGSPITGATGPSFALSSVLAADAGSYQLKVSNPLSTDVSSREAVLTVTGTPVAFADPAQPADQTIIEGLSVTFAAAAQGSAPLSYQWFKGATSINGATSASYTIPNVQQSDAAEYRVVVSNPLPSTATSRTARLVVVADRIPPGVDSVVGSVNKVVIAFSELVDPATAAVAGNYTFSGNLAVLSAVPNPQNEREVTLTTGPQLLGTVHCLAFKNLRDRFGNVVLADLTAAFVSTILIDGSFDDWEGVPLAYEDGEDQTTASDYQRIYLADDGEYLFGRVTLYAPSDLGIFYNNIFVDGDNNRATGYQFRVGSELLIQGGGGYQQKGGGFNEGEIVGLDWAIQPAGVGVEFEFRFSRRATFASDGLPVFTASEVGLVFDAENTSFQTVDTAPDGGGLLYTFSGAASVPLAPIRFGQNEAGELGIRWSGPGALQFRESLTAGQWSTISEVPEFYPVNTGSSQGYYRVFLSCPP